MLPDDKLLRAVRSEASKGKRSPAGRQMIIWRMLTAPIGDWHYIG